MLMHQLMKELMLIPGKKRVQKVGLAVAEMKKSLVDNCYMAVKGLNGGKSMVQ